MTADAILKKLRTKGTGGYISVNKNLLHLLGINPTIIFCTVLSMYVHYHQKQDLDSCGFFFCTTDRLYVETSLSGKQQRSAIAELVKVGLIEVKYYGLPKRRFIKPVITDRTTNLIFSPIDIEKKVKKSIPNEVYEKYSQPFDYDILKKQIAKACIKYDVSETLVDEILMIYFIYHKFSYKNNREITYYNQKNVDNLVREIEMLNSEYCILDEDMFEAFVKDYFTINFDAKGIRPNINNMLLAEKTMEILADRNK